MTTIQTSNKTLSTATDTITKINVARVDNVRTVINEVIAGAKDNGAQFTSKKNAVAAYVKVLLEDDKADKYFVRAVKVAKTVLVDGYKFKVELLTLAQLEQLSAFNKNLVNQLMAHDEEIYVDACKALINTAKVAKASKVFSRATAKAVK